MIKLYNQGLYSQVLEAAEKLAEQHPQSTETLGIIGAVSFEVKDFDCAISCYQLAAKLIPDSAETYFKMGIVFGPKGDLTAAKASFQKTLDINPEHANAHNNIGILFQKLGKTNDA
ncbi:MAG: tetratricopeptide repeat protein, partial [Pseudomonadales bacterium]